MIKPFCNLILFLKEHVNSAYTGVTCKKVLLAICIPESPGLLVAYYKNLQSHVYFMLLVLIFLFICSDVLIIAFILHQHKF